MASKVFKYSGGGYLVYKKGYITATTDKTFTINTGTIDVDCGLILISYRNSRGLYGGMSLITVSWNCEAIKSMTHNGTTGVVTVGGNTDAGITLTVTNESEIKAGDTIRYRISYIRNYDA